MMRRRYVAGGAPPPAAAFPVIADTNTSVVSTNETSHTMDLPPNISSGDLLLLVFASDGGAGGITWPAGYTEFKEFAQDTNVTLSLAYRQADGTEGATITVTTGGAQQTSHGAYRITGHVDPVTQAPEDSTGASGATANPDPDSLSPTTGAKDYLWIAVHANDGNKTTDAFPTSYDLSQISQAGGVSGAGVALAGRQLNAASEDPGSFTLNIADQWVAVTVAVHPP